MCHHAVAQGNVGIPDRRVHVAETVDRPDAHVALSPDDVVVVRQSRLWRNGGFALLAVVFVAVIVYGVTRKTVGGVAIAVVFGCILVVLVVLGFVLARNDASIEVSTDRVRYVGMLMRPQPEMNREQGADLLLYKHRTERHTSRELTLEQVATSVAWTLPFFTRRALRAACTSRGWHVESRWLRDRRAFGRRVTGDGLGVETAPGVPVTEAVDDPKAPVAAPSDVVVVNQSHSKRDSLFGSLAALLLLVLVDDFNGPGSTGDLISGAVFTGVLLVIVIIGWWRVVRRESRIEVSADRLRFVGRSSRRHPDLMHDQGVDLVMRQRLALKLKQVDTSVTWSIWFYSRSNVAAACTSRGWQVQKRRRSPRR